MGTTVVTRSFCDRCCAANERRGAEETVPPVGWYVARVNLRGEGNGWAGADCRGWDVTLCPECGQLLLNFLSAK
jgi:hypothetical protein